MVEVGVVNVAVPDSHLAETHPALDASNAERKDTCLANVPTRVDVAAWAVAPPQNVSSVGKKDISLASAPREAAINVSTARRKATFPGTVQPSGK